MSRPGVCKELRAHRPGFTLLNRSVSVFGVQRRVQIPFLGSCFQHSRTQGCGDVGWVTLWACWKSKVGSFLRLAVGDGDGIGKLKSRRPSPIKKVPASVQTKAATQSLGRLWNAPSPFGFRSSGLLCWKKRLASQTRDAGGSTYQSLTT